MTPRKGETWLVIQPGALPGPDGRLSRSASGIVRVMGKAAPGSDGHARIIAERLDDKASKRKKGSVPVSWLVAQVPWTDTGSD